jgi:hypothetical protein
MRASHNGDKRADLFRSNLIVWGVGGSSVTTVSYYRLEDRAIEVQSPAEAKDFSSSLCVQTDSGAHPDSCPMSTEGHFPGR